MAFKLSSMLDTSGQNKSSDDSGKSSVLTKVGGMVDSILGKKKEKGKDITEEVGYGYKKGGMVKKTGKALVHKGERVLTKKQAKKYNARKRA